MNSQVVITLFLKWDFHICSSDAHNNVAMNVPRRCTAAKRSGTQAHSDYPALCGSPDDPFGIMEIAVTGVDQSCWMWK